MTDSIDHTCQRKDGNSAERTHRDRGILPGTEAEGRESAKKIDQRGIAVRKSKTVGRPRSDSSGTGL